MQRSRRALGVNAEGHLTIEGWDAAKLARKFGTPLWVVSENTLRSNARALIEAFSTRYLRFAAAYGTKANHSPSITKIMLQEGAWVDCVSLTQLRLAAMASTPPEKIIFNGNNKTEEELESTIRSDVRLINIDSGDELRMIEGISRRLSKQPSVNVRIRGGYSELAKSDPRFVHASTEADKFGVDVPSGQAFEVCKSALGSKKVRLVGVHHHIGWSAYGIPYSSGLDLQRVRGETREVARFANELHSKLGFAVSVLDFGGGFRKFDYGRLNLISPDCKVYQGRTENGDVQRQAKQESRDCNRLGQRDREEYRQNLCGGGREGACRRCSRIFCVRTRILDMS